MKVLITGATGLVGRMVVNEFLNFDECEEVIALGRNEDKLAKLKDLGATAVKFDLTAGEFEFKKLDKWADALWIHCAAAVSGANQDVLDAVNIEGTRKLVERAEKHDVRFIHISSITVYGSTPGDFPEDAPFNPGSKYAVTKIAAEEIVKGSKLRWTMIRPPYIGGPGDENFLLEFKTRIVAHKMPILSKNGKLAIVDARDIASCIRMLYDNDKSYKEIYNIQGGTMGYKEFVFLLGDSLGGEKPYGKNYPYFFVYAVGWVLDMIAKVKGQTNERAISRYRIKSLASLRTMSTKKLETEIGFKPSYTIEMTVNDYVASESA